MQQNPEIMWTALFIISLLAVIWTIYVFSQWIHQLFSIKTVSCAILSIMFPAIVLFKYKAESATENSLDALSNIVNYILIVMYTLLPLGFIRGLFISKGTPHIDYIYLQTAGALRDW